MAVGGVGLSTFGLGEDFEEDNLIAMAEAGGGNFYYIHSLDQIPEIFSQELSGFLSIVAQNLKFVGPVQQMRRKLKSKNFAISVFLQIPSIKRRFSLFFAEKPFICCEE